jgi:hypothetical protein
VPMINVMVVFAQIAREVQSRIYIRRRKLVEKAGAAAELDTRLIDWWETLPGYLHKDRNSLRQPEFVNKQSTQRPKIPNFNCRNRLGIAILSPPTSNPPTLPRSPRRIRNLP